MLETLFMLLPSVLLVSVYCIKTFFSRFPLFVSPITLLTSRSWAFSAAIWHFMVFQRRFLAFPCWLALFSLSLFFFFHRPSGAMLFGSPAGMGNQGLSFSFPFVVCSCLSMFFFCVNLQLLWHPGGLSNDLVVYFLIFISLFGSDDRVTYSIHYAFSFSSLSFVTD